jgi:hypothetical protein
MATFEESSLSSWAGPYVTEMLGRGEALASMPYQAYMGPLTAGQSGLQDTAFQGLAGLNIPTNQQMTYNPMSFTGTGYTPPTAETSADSDAIAAVFAGADQAAQQGQMPTPMPTVVDSISHLDGYFGEGGDPFKGLMEGRLTSAQVNQALAGAQDRFDAANPDYQYAGGTSRHGAREAPTAAEQAASERMMNAMFAGNLGPNDRPIEGTTQEQSIQKDIERFSGTNTAEDQADIAAEQPMQQSPIEQYMSPYLQGALQPQYDAANRQALISAQNLQSQFGKAGAYGGSRQGVAEAELQRGLLDRMAGITGTGYQQAFEQAQNQFNTEQDQQMAAAGQAQRYGLDVLRDQRTAGATQRGIASQGIAADMAQFEQERDYDKNNTLFMQSLLKGLPLETQTYSYTEPSGLSSLAGGVNDVTSILDELGSIGGENNPASQVQYDMDALATYKDNYMTAGMDENDATLQAMKDIGMIS